MKQYLEHKNEIQSYHDVAETIKTIEKISASDIHQLKEKVKNLKSHILETERILTRLSLFYTDENHPLLQKNLAKNKMLVIISGNKGLVGGLWHNLINLVLEQRRNYQSLVVAGKKGKDYLSEEGIEINKSFINIADDFDIFLEYIFAQFKKKKFFQIDIVYSKFISITQQQPTIINFLPFKFDLTENQATDVGWPIFQPAKKEMFDHLLKKYIKMFSYKIIIEAKLVELSARTVTMEHAGAKTKDMIIEMTLNYFKERKKEITQRQLESFLVHKII